MPDHVHPDSMPCNVMCPAHPNTVKRLRDDLPAAAYANFPWRAMNFLAADLYDTLVEYLRVIMQDAHEDPDNDTLLNLRIRQVIVSMMDTARKEGAR